MNNRIPTFDEYSSNKKQTVEVSENSNDKHFNIAYPEINAILTVWLGEYVIVDPEDSEELVKYPIIQKVKDNKAIQQWVKQDGGTKHTVSKIDKNAAYVDIYGAFSAWCISKINR